MPDQKLPPYRAQGGPAAARQLLSNKWRMTSAAESLERALSAGDDAFVAAMDARSEREAKRDRIRDLSKNSN